MRSRLVGLFAAATFFCVAPAAASTDEVDTQTILNLKSQQTTIEKRIADLQRQVDEASAYATYCSAEDRTEDYNRIRALQREIADLGRQYAEFKDAFGKMAATPTAGPQFDAVGIHPDERSYWIKDDNALKKLRESALAKADRVEQSGYRDCNEKKTTRPPSAPVTETPPAKPPEPGPAKAPVPPPAPKGPTVPLGGCTDRQRTDAILRLQEEILRVEEELIPIDGTKPEGRARQLQLIAELDRLKKLMALACPPLLPPLPPAKPAPPPPKASKVPTFKVTPPTTPNPPKTQPVAPAPPRQVLGPIYIDPFLKLEDDADDALDDLEDAMDNCDEQAVKALIPQLEALSRAAHAAASAARAAGGFSRVNAKEAEAMARDLDEAIEDARKYKCLVKPLRGYEYLRLNTLDQRILTIHNEERSAVRVPDLKWDYKLEWDAIGYADHLAQTHQLTHAPREGRGIERENLLQTLPGWSPDRMMQSWTIEKRDFRPGYFPDVAIDGNWLNVAHYTQMIWPTTREIGCGYAMGGGFGWLVCRYSPGGNKDGKPVGLPDTPERG